LLVAVVVSLAVIPVAVAVLVVFYQEQFKPQH
jgi:hypothetical protein